MFGIKSQTNKYTPPVGAPSEAPPDKIHKCALTQGYNINKDTPFSLLLSCDWVE